MKKQETKFTKRKIRVVLDTNIFISSLLGSKSSKFIIEYFLNGDIDIVISKEIFLEIIETLSNKKFAKIIKKKELKELVELLKFDTEWVNVKEKFFVCRDVKDNIIIECAFSGNVDFIITGDDDLLSLKSFRNIPILSPKEFLKLLK